LNRLYQNFHLAIAFFCFTSFFAQDATVTEGILSLSTYGFDKPNALPILADNPKIYPYFKFEEYTHKPEKRDWKVVTLENEFIKVFILPEIGGKVWGAIEKSTGEEFLYKNEVIKFRNIAMRGPWTSGGIEFNFGIIGHHPGTATPVNYVTKKNADGSVSCFVGSTDLPSETTWQVEIRLEKNKAYFETNVSWYNGSPLSQSYYNWMTGAAAATDDLEFYIPGNKYLEHDGTAKDWPIDNQGRNLWRYQENNFGPSKSYHVVGEYNDFFGGYYKNSDFGFGQWSPYEEMPGQKLWLWSLSRSGGIWEDLLTDSDGQYIEFQAGRLFNQYFPGAINPISQVSFDPFSMEKWSEIWFPYKKIGGMVDASPHGVLNVTKENNKLIVGLNALQQLKHTLTIKSKGKIIFEENIELSPMEVFSTEVNAVTDGPIEVELQGTELSYNSDPNTLSLKRPFSSTDIEISESENEVFKGIEAKEYREYENAKKQFTNILAKNASDQRALIHLADIEIREMKYDSALYYLNRALKFDTYNSSANYLSGIAYRMSNDTINALESFGWAARDMKFRSVAFAQMAELYLSNKNKERASYYSKKALDFNTYNLNARKVQVIIARITENTDLYKNLCKEYEELFPLDHFITVEKQLANQKRIQLDLANEFASETILGLAMDYYKLSLLDEAKQILEINKNYVKNNIWSAYLSNDTEILGPLKREPIDFVLPYRSETVEVLEWASQNNDIWKFKYYLALNYLALGRLKEGKEILQNLNDIPDSEIFYLFRAKMLKDRSYPDLLADYQKALELNKNDWKIWEENILFQLNSEKNNEALDLAKKAVKKFSSNYNLELAYVKALVQKKDFKKAIEVLYTIQILPFEHASESRSLYEKAHLALAKEKLDKKNYEEAIEILEKAKKWPENIGIGKPYNPDERAQDYLLAVGYEYIGETEKNLQILNEIVEYTYSALPKNSFNHLYGLLALNKLKKTNELKEFQNVLEDKSKEENQAATKLALDYWLNKNRTENPNQPNHSKLDIQKEVALWALQN
tara:strand:+ start:3360 stop:6461 length:3102 start_codon:yes stop_codon:yes gene_type:complete